MPIIAFLLPQNPYLPELRAYIDYFTKRNFQTHLVKNAAELATLQYDIEWHFMGFDRLPYKKSVIKVHDFTSLSTQPLAKTKNLLKKFVSKKPHLRIFLNEKVKEEMNFKDNVPYTLRDMGIDADFFNYYNSAENKEFDFCYLGNMNKIRKVDDFLIHFKDRFKEHKILMIGSPPPYLTEMFQEQENIIFSGKIEQSDVPMLLSKCRFGINYVPDIYPFNIQTSTKLLEYCATGLKVISNRYKWVEEFEKEQKASFFFLENDFSNFTAEKIYPFHYRTPSLVNLSWEKILDDSRLYSKINELL